MRKAILDAGFSQKMADNPQRITESKTWNEVVAAAFPDDKIQERHNQLLAATRFENQTFPPGPKLTANKIPGSEDISDEELRETFELAQCKVLRILHKNTPEDHRVVYFVSPDNLARDKALDKVYKITGRYAEDQVPRNPHGNTYNFIFSAPVQDKVRVIEAEIKELLVKPKPDAQQN